MVLGYSGLISSSLVKGVATASTIDGVGLDGGVGAVRDGHARLGLHDLDDIRERDGPALLALRVVVKHDLDLDAEDALTEHDVPDGLVNVVLDGVTGADHVAILELH